MTYLISTFGYLSLFFSLILAITILLVCLYSLADKQKGSLKIRIIIRYMFYFIAFLSLICCILLFFAIINDKFNISYVYGVSSSDLELKYKWASLYSSQEGSLLLWLFLLTSMIAIFIRTTLQALNKIEFHIMTIFAAILIFTLIPLVFFTQPFKISTVEQIEGLGLNPLLVDPAMLIHPPILLSGLVSTAIPFTVATSIAIAKSSTLLTNWTLLIRRWILLAIFLLTLGNILGAWWAYTVLGWGGFWGWDPVENSAVLALLPMIALLHNSYFTNQKKAFTHMNIFLGSLGFILAIFTTFNVRSGAIDSVHSFAQSDTGYYYLIYLTFLVLLNVYSLMFIQPKEKVRIPGLLSKESTLIFNAFINLLITFSIVSTLILPIIFEVVKQEKIIISPSFYNQTIGSLLLILIIVLSISSILPPKYENEKSSYKKIIPLCTMLLAFFFIAIATNFDKFLPIFGIGCSMIICYGSLRAIYTNLLKPKNNFKKDFLKQASHLTHIGVAIFTIGAISATAFQTYQQFTISPGNEYQLGDYNFVYHSLTYENLNKNGIDMEVSANISIFKENNMIAELRPGKRFFNSNPNQPVGIVDIDRGITKDIYLFVQTWDEELNSQFHIYINPFINLLWLGGVIYLLGIAVALVKYRVSYNE